MKQEDIFELWGKVLKGDKDAKLTLVALYTNKYPHNKYLTRELSKENLHTMYLHLYNGDPKK